MPVPGDVVDLRILEDGRTVIESTHPRRFVLERRTVDGRTKVLAANVNLLVTVTALAHPPPRLLTLDQLLAFAEASGIEALVLFTKPDLVEPDEAETLRALYAGLGYQTILANPKVGQGMPALRSALEGRSALLAGVSGVGKSSIYRALGGETAVGEVSRHGLGRQTTSTARLYRMGEGFLIDSPGVSEFGLGKIEADALAQDFRELREPALTCRFRDCRHLQEPNCGVLAALARGEVAKSRFESYRRILLEPA